MFASSIQIEEFTKHSHYSSETVFVTCFSGIHLCLISKRHISMNYILIQSKYLFMLPKLSTFKSANEMLL